MGMFDELVVHCPLCGEIITFQSKAGECILATYDIQDIPPRIAGDLDGKYEHCENCESKVSLGTHTIMTVRAS